MTWCLSNAQKLLLLYQDHEKNSLRLVPKGQTKDDFPTITNNEIQGKQEKNVNVIIYNFKHISYSATGRGSYFMTDVCDDVIKQLHDYK